MATFGDTNIGDFGEGLIHAIPTSWISNGGKTLQAIYSGSGATPSASSRATWR
jgi:hypothetical protein